jgi:hypothetical protein
MAHDAGSRWDRFDFIWPNLQEQNGDWNTDVRQSYDSVVNNLHEAGMNMIGILLWTPEWAATDGASNTKTPGQPAPFPHSSVALMAPPSASSSPPQGLYEEWDDWSDDDGDPINYWGRFVHQVVSRYGDRVTHWEIWNEPEWDYFWTGTSAEYAQLLKVGYQATKAACSDCTVLFGGLHYWENPSYYKWVLNTISDDPDAAANNYFFDVMSVHIYSRSSTAYDIINEIRGGMTARVSDHPIWLTETGVPVWDDGSVDPSPEKYDYAATQEEAAAYTIQSYANAWASEVEKYFFFRTHDANMGEYFGLIRNDRSLRPAYVAYQVATRYMVSPTLTTRWSYAEGAQRVTLWGTPRGKLSVLWNTTPDTLTLDYTAILTNATLIDRWGITRSITSTQESSGTLVMGRTYTLTLPGATANLVSNPNDYIIGGEPYLVIEADTIPPITPTMQPLTTTTYTHTFAVSCTARDDATGIWGYDVQFKEEDEAWIDWLDISAPPFLFTGGEHGKTYCFRTRAWDQAGNRGVWADDPTCTTVNLKRDVHFKLGTIFGDENSDGEQDAEEKGLTVGYPISLTLVDANGADVITPTVGPTWEFTTTLAPGEYTFTATPPDWPSPPPGWMPRQEPFVVTLGKGVQEIHWPALGLLPHRASNYLPLILH